jgi:hypothetical protein
MGVPRWVQRGPAAAKEPGRLAGVGVQEPLELLCRQLPHRQPVAVVDRPAEVVVQVLVVEVVGVVVLAHGLLLKLVAVSRLCCWPRRVG